MKIKKDTFKKFDFENTKKLYETGNNKFWFVEVDIIEYYLGLYDPVIRPFFYENLVFFQKRTALLEMELLTNYLNFLYKNSEYDSFICFYDDYMKKFLEDKEVKLSFFKEFNELFRSLSVFYRDQISFINSIINDYYEHKSELAKTFDLENIDLKGIKLGCGDIHEKGVSTAILDFKDKKLMLKRGENHTGLVVDLYNIFLLQNGLSKVTIRSLEYEDFYYEEFLENTKITKVNDLMKSLGSLLFLAYLLSLTDLHYDNLMVSENKLIPIDCETIFNICEKKDDGKYDLAESILTPFILPFRRVNDYLFSGVSSEDRVFFENKDYILEMKDSGLSLKETYTREVQRSNSSLQGYKLANYEDIIVDSFMTSYKYFIQNKDQIIKEVDRIILNKKHRILKKNTSDYIEALAKSYQSYLMINTVERVNFFKKKNTFDMEEIASLMNNLVPTFFEDITFDKSYYDKFSEKDMLTQVKLIKASIDFELFEKIDGKEEKNYLADEKDYYDYLYQELIDLGSESFWIDLVNYKVNDKEISELIKVPDTIYAGKSGIFLFLLEYEHRNKILKEESRIHKLVQDLYGEFLQIVENSDSSCGIYDGSAGMFYLFYKYHKYTDRLDEKVLFSHLSTMIKNVDHDKQFDIISGQAGLLKLLTFMWEEGYKDSEIKSGIETIQKNLLKEVWDLDHYLDKNKYIGYSHGLIGLVSALAESYRINELPEIRETSNKLCQYLSGLMDEKRGIPSTRDQDKYYQSWCHGNSGALLGLYNIYKVFKDQPIADLMEKLLEIQVGESAYNYKLCHGNLGNYLICYNVSSGLDNQYYKDLYKEKLDFLTQKISAENFKYCNKNMMVGLSGLYYWKLLDWDMEGSLDLI